MRTLLLAIITLISSSELSYAQGSDTAESGKIIPYHKKIFVEKIDSTFKDLPDLQGYESTVLHTKIFIMLFPADLQFLRANTPLSPQKSLVTDVVLTFIDSFTVSRNNHLFFFCESLSSSDTIPGKNHKSILCVRNSDYSQYAVGFIADYPKNAQDDIRQKIINSAFTIKEVDRE